METDNINSEAMSAIRDALNRRGMGDQVPALNQQSMGSPTAQPLPATNIPTGATMPTTQSTMPSATSLDTAGVLPPKAENSESKLIISALKDRLKAISTIETSNGNMA